MAVVASMTALSTGPCEDPSPSVPQRERWHSQVVTCCSTYARVTTKLEELFVQIQMRHHLGAGWALFSWPRPLSLTLWEGERSWS